MPKNQFDYFDCLRRQCVLAARAVTILRSQNDLFRLPQALDDMRPLLDEFAATQREIAQAALLDFLPPLERRDLLGLSAALAGVAQGAAAGLRSGGGRAAAGPARQEALLERLPELLRAHKKQAAALLELAGELRASALKEFTTLEPPLPCEAFLRLADAIEAAAVNNI